MLKGELYERISASRIVLKEGSVIYRAHFPGYPITPGVCLLQIALELLDSPLKLSSAKEIKFLSRVIPEETPVLDFSFENLDGEWRASVTTPEGTQIAKMRFTLS